MTSEKEKKSATKSRRSENGFEEWGGYMAAKKFKLAAQFDGHRQMETEDQGEVETEIFEGISIYVNGYTKPTADDLKRLMMIHGGRYHYYYSSKTTHIVASNLPDSKIRKLKNKIVVKPDWIIDSIKAGRRLPYQDYLLYPPEFTHNQQTLRKGNFITSKAPLNTNLMTQNSISTLSSESKFSDRDCLFDEDSEESQETCNPQFHFAGHRIISSASSCTAGNSTITSKDEGPAVAGQPGFLSEFYSHSRLHHISTAGQELKRYVQMLAENHSSKTFPGRERLKELIQENDIPLMDEEVGVTEKNDGSKRSQGVVMHLDMDCFFVSVGLRKHPELKGKPVAVTHSKGKRGGAQDGSNIHFEAAHYRNQSKKKIEGITSVQPGTFDDDDDELNEEPKESLKISKNSKEYGSLSEIACCSYEARAAGLRNGMFLGEALRRCPDLKTIPYDFEGYSEVSKQLYDIVASYTLDLEAVSCDELFVDCTEILQDTGLAPLHFASILRTEIVQKTGCTASAGLGSNMLLARLANRTAKPNGQYFVCCDRNDEFMLRQKVKDLPGVGYTTSAKFEHQGVVTCGDLQSWSLAKLQQEFGPKTGQTLYNRCRGKDDRVVQLQKGRKSVSAEINYGIRFDKEEDIYNFLKELSIEVVNRLRNIYSKGKLITLKLMVRHPEAPVQTAKFMGHGVCEHVSKSVMLKSATDNSDIIGKECCTLAKSFKIKPEDYRGVGIQLSKLETTQKTTKRHKSIENFLCFSVSSNGTESDISKRAILPSNALESVNKSLTKSGTIEQLLTNKPSPSMQQSYQQQTLSLEELDQSVLTALPEDLRKEVLGMYNNNSSDKLTNSLSHSNTSSHSSKSNNISSKKHTNFSRAKRSKLSTKQNTLFNCFQSVKSVSNSEEGPIPRKKAAAIGGAEDINEVKSLLKEWVLSSQVVLDEDLDQFRDYILEVIDEDLEKVDLILKCFHRDVSTANSMWQQAYLTVLSYVQQKVLQKFGKMLDANSEFPT